MDACLCPVPSEGGVAAQVEQVESLSSSVPWASGSDCKLTSRGKGKHTVGPRIQLWESGFVSQTLSQRKSMGEEGVRNFKELRAKFQKFDVPPLPRFTTFPTGISQKGGRACTRSTQTLANGKPSPSNHSRPLSYCSSGQDQPPKTQKMKMAHGSEIHKSSSSPGPPPEKCAMCPARNSQRDSMLFDGSRSSAKTSSEEKGTKANSFRDKLWTWEKVLSQKTEVFPFLTNCGGKAFHLEEHKSMELPQEKPRKILETTGAQTLPLQRSLIAASEDSSALHPQHGRKSAESPSHEKSQRDSPCQPVYECELTSPAPEHPDTRHLHLPKTKPLPSIKTLGPPPPKPSKPPVVNLQAFYKQSTVIAKTPKEVTMKEDHLPPDSAEFEEPHNYEATISYLRHSGDSINPCAAEEIADSTYEVGIEELQKPWKSCLHQELSHGPTDEESNLKETCELEPQTSEEHTHSSGPPVTRVHQERQKMPIKNPDTRTDITQNKVFPEDGRLARHSQDQGGYVEALEVTKETPNPGTSSSDETYDDVECAREDVPQWDFTCSFTSDSEENSEEMYEDIYKTKSNNQKTDLDGKASLKRLHKFFKREKGRFKMKTAKSKENLSNGFSISLPDLGLRSRELSVYDDVGISEKESKDEEKRKTWKVKFLMPKGKKEQNSANRSESFSPRNFFKTKKQSLEKSRMEKEEKLFRERFQYDKEIVVINRAVACSSNSRNGVFDLPVTPGEQLEVIDTTEQNHVICRNSKGKYGYVLIEHLHFKHQG